MSTKKKTKEHLNMFFGDLEPVENNTEIHNIKHFKIKSYNMGFLE